MERETYLIIIYDETTYIAIKNLPGLEVLLLHLYVIIRMEESIITQGFMERNRA